ncbi:MAG: MerR family transcriptional regulator [Planctomycetes bacterium]|nr:MerR family transcriptional regulator [Planctomycetota bacterium]
MRKADRKLLRTAEILRATGISRQVLYRYLTLGLIREAEITPTGQRLFDPRTVSLIHLVRELNESGYSLRDLRDTFFRDRRLRRLRGDRRGP